MRIPFYATFRYGRRVFIEWEPQIEDFSGDTAYKVVRVIDGGTVKIDDNGRHISLAEAKQRYGPRGRCNPPR